MYRRNFDELGMQWNTILGIRKNVAQKKMDKSLVQLAVKPFFFGWFRVFPRKWDLGNEISGNCASTIEKGDGRPLKGLVVSQDQYHLPCREFCCEVFAQTHIPILIEHQNTWGNAWYRLRFSIMIHSILWKGENYTKRNFKK